MSCVEKASKLYTDQVLPEDFPLFTFIHFVTFRFIGHYLWLALGSTDVDSVMFVLDLHMKYSGVVLSTYMYCVVSYRVITRPCVRSVGCFFVLHYSC